LRGVFAWLEFIIRRGCLPADDAESSAGLSLLVQPGRAWHVQAGCLASDGEQAIANREPPVTEVVTQLVGQIGR